MVITAQALPAAAVVAEDTTVLLQEPPLKIHWVLMVAELGMDLPAALVVEQRVKAVAVALEQ